MIKVPIFCNSSSNECYWEKVEQDRKCKKSCFGLYADVWFDPPCKRDNFEDAEVLAQLEEEYFVYKTKFAENLIFDPSKDGYGMYRFLNVKSNTQFLKFSPPVGKRNYSKLDIFHIYFDTSTYDEIERDIKNSFEDQLGVLGGTMGLFTGFSILSGVELIFYLAKLFLTWGRRITP